MNWTVCQMLNNAKRGVISSHQFFSIIYISRAVVSFTYIQAVSVGNFASDILISYALSYVLSLLLSLPAVFCVKKGISPTDCKPLALAYAAYYVFICALTVNRFSYFAVSKMNPKISFAVIIAVVLVAVGYGAYLGLEALARFACFCAVVLGIVIAVVVLTDVKNFDTLNFYPFFVNSRNHILYNTLLFTANTAQQITLLVLFRKTATKPIKAYFWGISASYASVMLLLCFCCGVLGANADLQAFPILTLFKMASVSDMSRLDILHISFWIFAVYLKCAVMIFCACLCIKKWEHGKKVTVLTVCALILSLVFSYCIGMDVVVSSAYVSSAYIGATLYVFLTVLVPLIYCLVKERKNAQKN